MEFTDVEAVRLLISTGLTYEFMQEAIAIASNRKINKPRLVSTTRRATNQVASSSNRKNKNKARLDFRTRRATIPVAQNKEGPLTEEQEREERQETERQRRLVVLCENRSPMKKPLQNSDVRDDQARLALPKDFVKSFVLPLLTETEIPLKGIEVNLYDEEGKKYAMKLKLWSSNTYILTSGWKGFYTERRLKATIDVAKLWPFRHNTTGKLSFFIKVTRKNGSNCSSPSRTTGN